MSVRAFFASTGRTRMLSGAFCALFSVWAIGVAPQVPRVLRGESIQVALTIVSSLTINVEAIPEKRVPSTGNDSTILTIEVRNPGSTIPLSTQTVTTTNTGSYNGVILAVEPGTYDITAKGYSHLRRKIENVAIAANAFVDFTNNGLSPLFSGDVNGTVGDNMVNGIDLTLIVGDLNDVTERYDLNQDGLVNGLDLTNAVTNITDTGDA